MIWDTRPFHICLPHPSDGLGRNSKGWKFSQQQGVSGTMGHFVSLEKWGRRKNIKGIVQ